MDEYYYTCMAELICSALYGMPSTESSLEATHGKILPLYISSTVQQEVRIVLEPKGFDWLKTKSE